MRMRNYKKKSECPAQLDALIESVNLLPPLYRLKPLSNNESVQKCLKDTPEAFQQHIENLAIDRLDPIGGRPISKLRFSKQLAVEYESFRVSYDSLIPYVERLECERKARDLTAVRLQKDRKTKVVLDYRHFHDLSWDTSPLVIRTAIRRDSDGKQCITGLAALIGTFDDNRLRMCAICSRVCWAKKTNTETCGKKCADILGNQKRIKQTSE